MSVYVQGYPASSPSKMTKCWFATLILCFAFLQMAKGQCCPGTSSQNCTAKDNFIRLSSGRPVGDKLNSLTVGPRGPMLLQDITYIEEISHFDRERIPDRVVHAKGNGAFGYFQVSDDITRFTKAKIFSQVGKTTPIAVRFSIASADPGTADTTRDFCGFSVRFYTEEGNWDLVGINLPVFPVRDALSFPSFVRTIKGNPANNIQDWNRYFDFTSLRPEGTAFMILVFSDQGIPLNYRHIDGFGVNVFKMVNAQGEVVYCKFTYTTDQGVKYTPVEQAKKLAGRDPDIFTKDLFGAIQRGDYPSWTMSIQVMTMEEARTVAFNPFNPTREWPQADFPLIRVGKFVLNRNPENHFAEVEQLAFSPANLVPGIEASPDKVLQGRIFSYLDTQRYRLGVNFRQIPVNCPFRSPARNYERDGRATITNNGGSGPNYYPNSFGGPVENPAALESPFPVCGVAARFDTSEEDVYSQARIYFQRFDAGEKKRLAQNLAERLATADPPIQERLLRNLRQVQPELEKQVRAALATVKGT